MVWTDGGGGLVDKKLGAGGRPSRDCAAVTGGSERAGRGLRGGVSGDRAASVAT